MAVSDAHKRASVKYNASKDNIMLRPSKEDGARIRKAAADSGKSVQRFCLDLVLPHCPTIEDATPAGDTPDDDTETRRAALLEQIKGL